MSAPLSIPIGEADFVPLSRFPLAWRWTDARWNVLPAAALARIRPLAPAPAHQAWRALLPLLDVKAHDLSAEWFDRVESTGVSADSADAIEAARHWLTGRVRADAGDVVVSWGASHAVVTTADVFCRYWDDFCYPASDDAIVWSVRDDWVVLYHHYERLSFGSRRRTP